MNTQTLKTPWIRTSAVARSLSVAALAAGVWALSSIGSEAHARSDVHWSIGVHAPGVVVGATNAPPVYYAPAPVYYAPAPVYYAPRPVYYGPPPVFHAPRPVYRSGWGPAPRWEGHRHGHRHGPAHGRGHDRRR